MPKYAKKRNYKRKNYKKSKTNTIKQMIGNATNTALDFAGNIPGPIGTIAKSLSFVKRLINVETKNYDTNQAFVINNSGTHGYVLNGVTGGTGATNRIGNSVISDKLMIKGTVSMTTPGTDTPSVIRLALVYDKKPDVGAVTYSSVFGSSDINAFNDLNNSDRYIKLWDYKIHTNFSKQQTDFQKYVPLPSVHIKWDGPSDFEKGAIYFVICSNTGTPSIVYNSRYLFYDN